MSKDAKVEKPSLDEFIAALPACPDCGNKLHSHAYCPGKHPGKLTKAKL